MQLTQRGHQTEGCPSDSEYTYDHHEVIQTLRKPLGKSTGNLQSSSIGSLSLCRSSHPSLSPSVHSIPTSPVLPTQSMTSTYDDRLQNHRLFSREVSLRESSIAYLPGGRNPIYSWKHFSDYRAKVLQKEHENEEPKWPVHLEDAFLDALLLIPFMGRKKVSAKGQLYGRNMLVTEYLWICHWLLHPPQPGEIVPVGKERETWGGIDKDGKDIPHLFYRGRKQVSSHIQVLKQFFKTHPCFHFFFPRKTEPKGDDRSIKEDEGETESFKNNRVLTALAEGHLPDERPNYEYFARLLAADSEVFVRPKRCWIYVSSSEVTLSSDSRIAQATDGTILNADAYTPQGQRLECGGDYPHLVLNSNTEVCRDIRRGRDSETPKHLLHEYTRKLDQNESSSVKEVSKTWGHHFPELHDNLLTAIDETHPSHKQTSRCVVGPCDTFQFEVVLDLHATSRFPSGTHLEGSVQLQICRPELANHSWRSVTSISKPKELEHEGNESNLWKCVNNCDLVGGRNSDVVEVPFPAKCWASTFFRLSTYVQAESEQEERRRGKDKKDSDEVEGRNGSSRGKYSTKRCTPNELLEQVAMYQEIWSAPNEGSEEPNWTRRAIILWTFSNTSSKTEKGKTSTTSSGTSWRFLTKIDPMSQYHQQRALVIGTSPHIPGLPRDAVMSPDPAYAAHLSNAAMHENFSNATRDRDPQTMTVQGQPMHSYPPELGPLEDFSSGGLATPPELSSSYAHSFDSATISSTGSLHPLGFLSHGSGADSHGTLVGRDDHSITDPFLAGLGLPAGSTAFDEDPGLQEWANQSDGSLGGLAQWPTAYIDHQHDISWPDDIPDPGSDEVGTTYPTPWDGGRGTPWATAGSTMTNDAASQQSNCCTTATSQAWLQSIATMADANAMRYEYAPWDYRAEHQQHQPRHTGLHTTTSSVSSLHSASANSVGPAYERRQHVAIDEREAFDSGSGMFPERSLVARVKMEAGPEAWGSPMGGRKRARTEENETDDDREDYPCSTIRKLAHDNMTNCGPPANMNGEEHGSLF